jgi:hypothetical protein
VRQVVGGPDGMLRGKPSNERVWFDFDEMRKQLR